MFFLIMCEYRYSRVKDQVGALVLRLRVKHGPDCIMCKFPI